MRGVRELRPGMGVLRVVARASLLILVATCQVDKLTNNPPPVATLSLEPSQVRDSAAVGSTAVDGDSVAVINTGPGTLSWSARLVMGGSWLAFVGPTSGTAPAKLRLAFNPAGLATGVYRDTVFVSAENAAGSPGRVPVEFVVHPCMPVAIVPDVQVSDSITTRDCAAPHRSASFARLYSFTAVANDSISVVMTSIPVDAYVVLDSSAAPTAPPLGLNDSCSGGGRDACFRYQLLRTAGTYLIEATSATEGQTGRFTLSVTRPRTPNVPASLAQLRSDSITAMPVGGSTDESTVVLRGVLGDPDAADSLRLEVEARPVGTAFTGAPTQTGSRVANGQTGFVAVPGLANNTGYHWQARTADQTGRASGWTAFGGNSESAADFSTSVPVAPSAPTGLAQFQSDGTTAIGLGGTANGRSVTFQAVVTDPNPGDQLRLEVEAQPVGTAFSGTASGSGSSVANGGIATAVVAGLSDNTSYHWRARTVDQTNRSSDWVSFGSNPESATDFRVAVTVTQLVFTQPPTTTAAGAAITPAVRVEARDANDATVTSFGGVVSMEIGTNPAGGSLSGTTNLPAANGVATFSNLAINRAAGGYTLRASSGTVTQVSPPFTIIPGAATQLTVTTQPSATAPSGVAFAQQPVIQLRDAAGNAVSQAGVTVTAAIATGGGTLGGALSATTTASGVASFTNLSISGTAGDRTLSFSATGLTGINSTTITITAGAATPLTVTTQPPATAQSGGPVAQQPGVQLADGGGNARNQERGTVAAAVAPRGRAPRGA